MLAESENLFSDVQDVHLIEHNAAAQGRPLSLSSVEVTDH